uniref:G_PROTEIN_RECEP_F1_2 domain-containing protein n=1 Tax=Rhabditophanes sp. KR3021 TaxID=114890 RepID=A0AC35U325_9BILA
MSEFNTRGVDVEMNDAIDIENDENGNSSIHTSEVINSEVDEAINDNVVTLAEPMSRWSSSITLTKYLEENIDAVEHGYSVLAGLYAITLIIFAFSLEILSVQVNIRWTAPIIFATCMHCVAIAYFLFSNLFIIYPQWWNYSLSILVDYCKLDPKIQEKLELEKASHTESSESMEDMFLEHNAVLTFSKQQPYLPEAFNSESTYDLFYDLSTILITCVVEYSIIGAAIFFVTWKEFEHTDRDAPYKAKRKSHIKIDCSNSFFGLFTGIAFLSACLTSIAIYYSLYIFLACRLKMKSAEAKMTRPGKQMITTLLISNIGLFFYSTLEGTKTMFTESAIFDIPTFTSILYAVSPLVVFFRFHSSVYFAEVWKHCYSTKSHHGGSTAIHSRATTISRRVSYAHDVL